MKFLRTLQTAVTTVREHGRSSKSDDYDWHTYSEEYRRQLDEISAAHTQILKPGDYGFRGDNLEKINEVILPLHPNHFLLYQTIHKLKPQSVMEIGCGGGDHLGNLEMLMPGLALYGTDLSEDQLELLRQRHPALHATVFQSDATIAMPVKTPQVDVAFTQAVIMHMHVGNSHLVAMCNVFRAAKRQVLLMENWRRHSFLGDIEGLFAKGLIPWESIHFYSVFSEELQRPHLLIASATSLTAFEPLTDYQVLG